MIDWDPEEAQDEIDRLQADRQSLLDVIERSACSCPPGALYGPLLKRCERCQTLAEHGR